MPSRRGILRAATILAVPALLTHRASADDQLTVADNGGPYGPACRRTFYDPFEQATGIKVLNVVHPAEPTAQFRAIVAGSLACPARPPRADPRAAA